MSAERSLAHATPSLLLIDSANQQVAAALSTPVTSATTNRSRNRGRVNNGTSAVNSTEAH